MSATPAREFTEPTETLDPNAILCSPHSGPSKPPAGQGETPGTLAHSQWAQAMRIDGVTLSANGEHLQRPTLRGDTDGQDD